MSRISRKHAGNDAEELRRHAGDAAALLKALANEQRLSILCTLLQGPLSVGELNARVVLSQSALSQHLAVLREHGLVDTEKSGQTVTYSLCDGPARKVLQTLKGIFCPP